MFFRRRLNLLPQKTGQQNLLIFITLAGVIINWSESDFQRVAKQTRLSERSLFACHQVLVHGVSSVLAAAEQQVFPSALSRAIGVMRDKHESMVEVANQLKEDNVLFKTTAIQVAKSIVGDNLGISDAVIGRVYEGRGISNINGYFVQKISPTTAVIHDISRLNVEPAMNALLSIAYPGYGKKAIVTNVDLAEEKSSDLGR